MVKFDLCASSVKHMHEVNKTLRAYGTKYLLPNENDNDCIFRYICNEKKCPHHNQEYFSDIRYPYEHQSLNEELSGEVKQKINEESQKICEYYGIFHRTATKDSLCDSNVTNGIIKHMWDDNRTFFSREYDRIIYTTAFRRLQYKTQVMVNSASDDQRTRLLHSLEVQKIAKKIAMGIGANWELAETIAIAHDIGHTPFGHEGESIIKHFLQEKKCGVFSHALQSVKVLDMLTEHPILNEYKINGLGLSNYVLEGVLKHDSDTFTDGMLNDEFKLQYNVEHLCGIVGVNNTKYLEDLNEYLETTGVADPKMHLPQVLIGSIESQIVAWADKMAYLGHDWEEFIDTGLLEKMMSRINDMVLEIEDIARKSYDDDEAKQIVVIWKALETINNIYVRFNNDNSGQCASEWDNVQREIEKIIIAIHKIEKSCVKVKMDNADDKEPYHCHKYFSAREYAALKNYFIMTAAWVNLLEVYPRTYGLKNDPVYIFYMYLTKIRSNIIIPRVTEKLIERTMKYIEQLDPEGKMHHDEYLLHCNKQWVYKYALVNRKMYPHKKARKLLKKSVRSCFLVGFHDEVETDINYIVGMESENIAELPDIVKAGYDFKQNYNCLLYLVDCIYDEFIRSTRVKFMKHTAQEIITTLLNYYYDHPDMLPYSHRIRYNNLQYELAIDENIPEVDEEKYTRHAHVTKARAVADYIANMTDRMAKLKYDEIRSSDTKWSNAYTTNLT